MQTIFSTSDVPPADAFEYWLDVACARIIRHESEPVDPDHFYAELKAASLADLSLLAWKMAPAIGRVSRSDAARPKWVIFAKPGYRGTAFINERINLKALKLFENSSRLHATVMRCCFCSNRSAVTPLPEGCRSTLLRYYAFARG